VKNVSLIVSSLNLYLHYVRNEWMIDMKTFQAMALSFPHTEQVPPLKE